MSSRFVGAPRQERRQKRLSTPPANGAIRQGSVISVEQLKAVRLATAWRGVVSNSRELHPGTAIAGSGERTSCPRMRPSRTADAVSEVALKHASRHSSAGINFAEDVLQSAAE